MGEDEIWGAIHAQRGALADVLQSLSAADWEHSSLGPDRTVRDVAAHVISSPQATHVPCGGSRPILPG